MKKQIIKLPKQYQYIEGQSRPEYKKYDGWEKISYSQLNSFKDYKAGYIQDYIAKLGNGDSGIFAEFGGAVGKYFEDKTVSDWLSKIDLETIDKLQKHPSGKYESEIVVSLEPFGLERCCIQGFSDYEYIENDSLYIEDLKTGACKSMLEKYADMTKYYQTRLYAYQRENEGFEIGGCRVNHLDRKGNNTMQGDKNVLRLTGQINYIPTPYKREDAELWLKDVVVPCCVEISEYFSVFNLFFGGK